MDDDEECEDVRDGEECEDDATVEERGDTGDEATKCSAMGVGVRVEDQLLGTSGASRVEMYTSVS
jgi:hypothetical protein